MSNLRKNLDKLIKKRWSKNHHSAWLPGFLTKIALFASAFLLVGMFGSVVALAWLSYGLPSAEQIRNLSFTESTQILDREGGVLYTIHGEENRNIIPLENISETIVDATVSIEDKNFYQHHGFYIKRIIGAFVNNIQGKPVQGASTITQQFVKNAFLSPEKTLTRKLKELILAIKVEKEFTKDEIMELYLNAIPYGNNAYGIQQAAKIYFNKNASDLTVAESAILAALPKAPSRYNPYGSHRYPYLLVEFTPEEIQKRNIKKESDLKIEEFSRGLLGKIIHLDNTHQVYIRGRADIVLTSMLQDELITEEEKQIAWEELQTVEFNKYREKISAPHFVFYIRELLEDKYGKEVLQKGGFKVYTTIDPKLQKYAEEAIENNVERNTEFKVNNAALVSIDPNTGQILAMVGSADYWNDDVDGKTNVTTQPLQPGSSFKPFVYAKMFSQAPYGPGTPVFDVRTNFGGDRPPENFDGIFKGQIPFRKALGESRNIPAIKAYFLAGEEKEILPFVKKFGININPNRYYGWPLGLGTGELKLLELTAGYGVFAASGQLYPTTGILKIVNTKGDIIEEWKPPQKPPYVIDPQVAFLINSILSDPVIHVGRRLRLENHIVGAKTGTATKKNPDDPTGKKVLPSNLWTVMYSTDLVTGVWAGRTGQDDNLKFEADGYSNAAPIVNEFMTKALEGKVKKQFPRPKGIEEITISFANGFLPGPDTPENMLAKDFFASFSKPTEIDHDFKTATIDKLTGLLATEFTPENLKETGVFREYHSLEPDKYSGWDAAVKAWAAGREDVLPTETTTLHTQETFGKQPSISIVSPQHLGTIETGQIIVKVRVNAPNEVEKVEFFLNDKFQFIAQGPPYNGLLRLSSIAKTDSQHTIKAVITDKAGYTATDLATVTVSGAETSADDSSESNLNPSTPEETAPASDTSSTDNPATTPPPANPE